MSDMRLNLIFYDEAWGEATPLANAEIRVHGFYYYQEQLTAVPMNNPCSRLEFSLPLAKRSLHSDFATLAKEPSHFGTEPRLALSLQLAGSRKQAFLGHYLDYMVQNLSEEFRCLPENLVVTLKTHPLNGTFKDSVRLKEGDWTLDRPAAKAEQPGTVLPAYALTA